MTVVARRLWLYGLCLLLPALTVGALALGLLARERTRLAEREEAARESRRAAVESRARLIAENIELLVGDVQSALMTTLLEAPQKEPRAFLTEWQASNPFVRDVFRATAEGRPIWGATSDPLRGWLGREVPWTEPGRPSIPGESAAVLAGEAAPEASSQALKKSESQVDLAGQVRGDISFNVNQYQSVRQLAQGAAKVRNYADVVANGLAEQGLAAAPSAAPVFQVENVPVSVAEVASEGAAAFRAQVRLDDSPSLDSRAPTNVAIRPDPLTRSGWTPWRDTTGLHLFGWRELPDRTVIGLELRLDAIKARLGEVFPVSAEPGEAYAVRDADGGAWHQAGSPELPEILEVPLAEATLPGWTVVARMAAREYGASSAGGFFAFGVALVGLLVLAILAAGALLVRQARLSEIEAARKTSFVANVSHELKTPLTTIRLYAELLAEGRVRDEAKRADYLVTIGQETQRLGRLVANVLDFSRLEQGKKKYAPAALDLAAELRRLADTHAPRLAVAGLALRVEAQESLALTTDRDAVEQIVLNLLDNACKYAAEGGEVLLRLSTEGTDGGARARLVVADRGPGVPAEQRERIFEKFHRVDDRLVAEKAGAGLGLSIARQLARGLGGDLRCEAAPGGGAAFALTLPLFP